MMQMSEKPRSISQRKTNAEPPVKVPCAPRLEQSGAPGENAADVEGCDEAAAERKRAERSFATAAGREGAVVLWLCGLREQCAGGDTVACGTVVLRPCGLREG